MEFMGVGTIPYEAPAKTLIPFFKRKFKTAFRIVNRFFGGGDVTKEHMSQFSRTIANNVAGDEREKDRVYRVEVDIWDTIVLMHKERISEEECIKEWIDIVFHDHVKRKKMMTFIKGKIRHGFETVDTSKKGQIDHEQFKDWYKMRCTEIDTTELLFNVLDVNQDGVISLMEWGYGIMDFFFQSGPHNANSLYFGNLVADE